MRRKLKCYSQVVTGAPYGFYILNKGLNSGKPMRQPCPNCFVFSTDDPEECEDLFWLCYALWQTGYFKQYQNGSVIPFLRIDDVSCILEQQFMKVRLKPAMFEKIIQLLSDTEEHTKAITNKLALIDSLKKETAHVLMYS